MRQKELSRYIRIVVVLMAFASLLSVVLILPNILSWRIEASLLADSIYSGGIIIAYIALIPIFLSLVGLWQISTQIAGNNSFSKQNADTLSRISYYGIAETAVFLCAMALLLLSGKVDIPLFAMLIVLLLACVFVSILAAALSHLTFKAAVLKTDNDLTI